MPEEQTPAEPQKPVDVTLKVGGRGKTETPRE